MFDKIGVSSNKTRNAVFIPYMTMEVAFIVNVMSESGENVNLGNPVKEANQENQVNWLKMSIIGQHQNTNKEDFLLSH